MVAADTPNHVLTRVAAVFSAMSGAERVRCAMEMAEEAKEVTIAGIRARNPEATEREIAAEWMRLLHGDAIADEIARCSSTS